MCIVNGHIPIDYLMYKNRVGIIYQRRHTRRRVSEGAIDCNTFVVMQCLGCGIRDVGQQGGRVVTCGQVEIQHGILACGAAATVRFTKDIEAVDGVAEEKTGITSAVCLE